MKNKEPSYVTVQIPGHGECQVALNNPKAAHTIWAIRRPNGTTEIFALLKGEEPYSEPGDKVYMIGNVEPASYQRKAPVQLNG